MDDIPVIDLKNLSEDEGVRREMAFDMKQAFMSAGFAAVVNHNITESAIDKIWNKMNSFFALPLDIKEKYLVEREGPYFWGYTPIAGKV